MRRQLKIYPAARIEFKTKSVDPGAWFSTAHSVRHAALVLWRELGPALDQWATTDATVDAKLELSLRLRGPFAMLAGMAIENMLKGLILQRTARDARLELMSKKKLITHDLVTLATRAGVELADFEQELLARLSRFIVWAGRYPVALTATDTENTDRDLTSDDYPMLVELSQRLLDVHLKTAEL
jgi:hypothetical protein